MSDHPPVPPLSPRYHLGFLLLACAVLVAAFCLQVTADDRVALRPDEDAKLPPLCISRTFFDVKCPGCGLTRSFVHLAHGDLWSSIRSHRLGWLLFGLTLAQIPYRLHEIYRPAKSRALLVFTRWLGWVLVVLMLANWVGELFFFR
jgi:hypothetical protein